MKNNTQSRDGRLITQDNHEHQKSLDIPETILGFEMENIYLSLSVLRN